MGLLSSWISSDIDNSLRNFNGSFSKGQPFPHVVVPNFLQEEKAEELLKALRKEKFEHKESDLFSFNQTKDFDSVQNDVLKQFYLFAASSEFSNFMQDLTGITVKKGALDLAGSLYKGGDYLLCHDDQVEDRKIAYILYLSKDFTQKDGARFVLFNNKNGKPHTEAKAYIPAWNSLLVFEVSDLSFHSVEENCSDKDRYAIGGWLH